MCQRLNPDFQKPRILYVAMPVLLVAAIIIDYLTHKEKNLHNKNYMAWIAVFTSFCLLSYIWTEYPSVSMKNFLYNNLITMIPLAMYLRTKDRIESFVKIVIAVVIITLVYALTLGGVTIGDTGDAARFAGESETWNANGIGTMAAICTLFCTFFYEKYKQKKYIWIMLFCIAVTLVSGSRKSLLLIGIGILIYNALQKGEKKYIRLLIAGVACVIVYYLIMNVEVLYYAIGVRIESAIAGIMGNRRGADNSFLIRADLIEYGLKVFSENKLKGVGVDSFRYYYLLHSGKEYYAHNNYIELLADVGIFGTVIYYVFPFRVLIKSWLMSHKKISLWMRIIPSIMGAVLICDYAGISYNNRFIQVVFLLCIAMYNCERLEKDETSTEKIRSIHQKSV